jgi:hypothetical protein
LIFNCAAINAGALYRLLYSHLRIVDVPKLGLITGFRFRTHQLIRYVSFPLCGLNSTAEFRISADKVVVIAFIHDGEGGGLPAAAQLGFGLVEGGNFVTSQDEAQGVAKVSAGQMHLVDRLELGRALAWVA